jgi:hypothetical protein
MGRIVAIILFLCKIYFSLLRTFQPVCRGATQEPAE